MRSLQVCLKCRRGQSMHGWRTALLQGLCTSFMSMYDLRKILWNRCCETPLCKLQVWAFTDTLGSLVPRYQFDSTVSQTCEAIVCCFHTYAKRALKSVCAMSTAQSGRSLSRRDLLEACTAPCQPGALLIWWQMKRDAAMAN